MEDNAKLIEKLLERTVEYGETSFELLKLKTLGKASDVISSFAFHSIVVALIASFMLFLSLGFAFWLGEILGKICYGFFIVGAFYGIIGIVIYFFMHRRLKENVRNYVIKQLLK